MIEIGSLYLKSPSTLPATFGPMMLARTRGRLLLPGMDKGDEWLESYRRATLNALVWYFQDDKIAAKDFADRAIKYGKTTSIIITAAFLRQYTKFLIAIES